MAQELGIPVQEVRGTMPHFEAVRQSELKKEMTDERRAALVSLFDDIESETRALWGKTRWFPVQNKLSNEKLRTALYDCVKHVGVSVPAAILFDATEDDYVR